MNTSEMHQSKDVNASEKHQSTDVNTSKRLGGGGGGGGGGGKGEKIHEQQRYTIRTKKDGEQTVRVTIPVSM